MLEGAVEVRPGLGVDAEDVGAGVAERLQVGIGRRDHQMDVHRDLHVRAQRLHHVRADGDVGDEVAVHHVDVQPIGARRLDRAGFLAETRKIRRQDRRGYEGSASHAPDLT
jgi:hypothetical protein